MMATMIAPTRSNLLKLKDDLAFARLGYELLDQKRSILVVELLTMVDQAVDYQARVDAALSISHDSLQNTVLQMGRLKVNNVFPAVRTESAVELSERKVMGVHLPRVTTSFIDTGPYFSPEGTTLSVEESLEKFREALSLMGRLAELKVLYHAPCQRGEKDDTEGKCPREDSDTEPGRRPQIHETAYRRG